jgi:hypothetical protein
MRHVYVVGFHRTDRHRVPRNWDAKLLALPGVSSYADPLVYEPDDRPKWSCEVIMDEASVPAVQEAMGPLFKIAVLFALPHTLMPQGDGNRPEL